MKTHILTITNTKEQIAFKAILWTIVVSFVIYGMLVINMVFDTVDRKAFEKEMRVLYSKVGILEGDYILRATSIDLSFAHVNGFHDADDVKFTTRNTVVGVYSSLRNEI